MTTTPNITTEVPRKCDNFVARTTEIVGRTFFATATEFSDPYKPVDRISLNVHHDAFPDDGAVYGNVVDGLVNIDIGDLSVWLPAGREADVVAALEEAIMEQARQAKAGMNPTAVHLTGVEVADGGVGMRHPELACDWCAVEVPNGEGVAVDDDRVCSECWEDLPSIVRSILLAEVSA